MLEVGALPRLLAALGLASTKSTGAAISRGARKVIASIEHQAATGHIRVDSDRQTASPHVHFMACAGAAGHCPPDQHDADRHNREVTAWN